jgi:hypothetical protein
MKNQKRPTKRTSPINLLRGAVGSKQVQTLVNALGSFKGGGQAEKFPVFYSLASYNPNFSGVICAAHPIKQLWKLGGGRILKLASFSRELQWATVICYFSRNNINEFIRLRSQFFLFFESSEFSKANQILDEIDEKCGKSLWVIENRICLLNRPGFGRGSNS